MDNKEYLDEIFALPVNLKSVGTVSGFELYSSDSLKDKFIESLEKSNYAGIFKGIRTLVNNGTIVPAFGTRNLFRFIMVKKPKFLTHDDEVTYVAFVDFDSQKIYFLIENSVNMFGYSDNNKIAETLLHELCHVFCLRRPKTYLNLFSSELTKYYKYAFDKIVENNFSKNDLRSFTP